MLTFLGSWEYKGKHFPLYTFVFAFYFFFLNVYCLYDKVELWRINANNIVDGLVLHIREDTGKSYRIKAWRKAIRRAIEQERHLYNEQFKGNSLPSARRGVNTNSKLGTL